MTDVTDRRARVRQATVERITAAAADRDRLAREAASAVSVDACRVYRGALRDAAAALHAAVIDAHHSGVPAADIAAAAGTTARAVAVLLQRAQGVAGGRRVGGRAIARRAQALDAVADAVREHGIGHPAAHRAIVEAHARGVSPPRLGSAAGTNSVQIGLIVLAAQPSD